MLFSIKRTSDGLANPKQPCEMAFKRDGDWVIEIKDLEALIDFMHIVESEIVLSFGSVQEEKNGINGRIEIYDDYRE